MNIFLEKDGVSEKKPCPYKDKCYRKNPIHFNEMSHPHLEQLIINQLDSTIKIPDDLDFDCSDRSQLLDQLKVLQMVLKKERDRGKGSKVSQSINTPTRKSVTNNDQVEKLQDLKEKIEKHKQVALERRENRLREMDGKFEDEFTSKKNVGNKRSPQINNTTPQAKKAKINDKTETKINELDSNFTSIDSQSKSCQNSKSEFSSESSAAKKSYIDNFVSANNITVRQKIRDQAIAKMIQAGHKVSLCKQGEFALKYALSAPYHYFFNRVEKSQITHDQQYTVTFPELLDISLGEIVDSLHINFMVEIGWLCLQYLLAAQIPKMTIFCGSVCDPQTDSANPSDGESPTNFKKCFREYLGAYKHTKLIEWEHLVKKADFSAVNVFFVASIPGSHKGLNLNLWGHRKLASILSKHAVLPPDAPQWTLTVQCSSIGSLGPYFESWLSSNLVVSMSREQTLGIKCSPDFQFIYPSLKNYEQSYDCKSGSCCLPYSRKSHEKQQWLNNYLYQWKADESGRTKAMPHIKTYTRISPDQSQIPWFVLTSANLSKGAWGVTAKTGISHYIMNYEAGVVFIPTFIINQTTFPIKNSNSPEIPVFPLPYDLPLTKYQPNDTIFVSDFLSD